MKLTVQSIQKPGGDSDTLAAITCGIAGAYYGVPDWIEKKVWGFLDDRLKSILAAFEDFK